ncbi:MAG TPA: hypothetical protein VIJ24_07825, partial [Verrucomicrobiae bacterium]
GEFADEFLNLFRRESFPFALGFDERQEVHTDLPSQARNSKKYQNAANKKRPITIRTTQRCPSALENSLSRHLGAAIPQMIQQAPSKRSASRNSNQTAMAIPNNPPVVVLVAGRLKKKGAKKIKAKASCNMPARKTKSLS